MLNSVLRLRNVRVTEVRSLGKPGMETLLAASSLAVAVAQCGYPQMDGQAELACMMASSMDW